MAFTSSPNKLEKISQFGIEQLFLLDDGIDPIDLVMALTVKVFPDPVWPYAKHVTIPFSNIPGSKSRIE